MDAPTIDPYNDGEFLTVFRFEEEAKTFLQLLGDDGKTGWWTREVTVVGELVSVLLLAPRAEVQGVALVCCRCRSIE